MIHFSLGTSEMLNRLALMLKKKTYLSFLQILLIFFCLGGVISLCISDWKWYTHWHLLSLPTEQGREKEKDREREREIVCVCVLVRERERWCLCVWTIEREREGEGGLGGPGGREHKRINSGLGVWTIDLPLCWLLWCIIQVSSLELVQEIHQLLMDREDCCHRTCFSLQLDSVTMDNFAELKAIEGLKEGSVIKVVEGQCKLTLLCVFNLLALSLANSAHLSLSLSHSLSLSVSLCLSLCLPACLFQKKKRKEKGLKESKGRDVLWVRFCSPIVLCFILVQQVWLAVCTFLRCL